MLRVVFVALVTLGVALLTVLMQSPSDAASNDYAKYTWSFARVGSNQVVCKKLVIYSEKPFQPRSSKSVQVDIASSIVEDSYCANLAKPVPQA